MEMSTLKSKDMKIEVLERVDSDASERDADGDKIHRLPAETAHDLVTEVLRVQDDPTQSPWTFRMWFLGNSDRHLPSSRID